MKRGVVILALLVFVLIAGGVITSGVGIEIPTIQQAADPAASPFEATPEQANYLVLMIGFILVNVIGAGLTIAFLLWLGSREVKIAHATPTRSERAAALPETAQS